MSTSTVSEEYVSTGSRPSDLRITDVVSSAALRASSARSLGVAGSSSLCLPSLSEAVVWKTELDLLS